MSISCGTQREESRSLLLNLPEGVHDEIFLKVPAKSILVSRCVCKFFCNLLSKPRFIKNHVNRTNQIKNNNPKLLFSQSKTKPPVIHSIPIDNPSLSSSDGGVLINYPFESKNSYYLEFLGSCNGLICLKIFANRHNTFIPQTKFCILNPLTREFKEIQFQHRCYDGFWKPKNYGGVTYGFGYDGNIDDYKLVMTNYDRYGSYTIDVYSVKSDSCSTIQGMGKFGFHCFKGYSGVFFNGCLHFLAHMYTHGIWSEVIFSFDVCNEVVGSMPLPENVMPHTGYSEEVLKNVGVWGDCIGIACILNSVRIDVWVMQEYGVKESWVKKYTTTQLLLPLQKIPFWKLLWCFNHGELLLDTGKQILLYEPRTERVTSVVVSDIDKHNSRQIYVETLVSLGSGTYLEKPIADEVVKHPE